MTTGKPGVDPAQKLAAEQEVTVRQLVLAGPGTGKTQTVALRIEHLIRKKVRPAQILVLSFSRSAVRTLVRRLARFSAGNEGVLDDLRHVSIRTFDSWTFRLLRQLGHVPCELLSGSHDRNIARLTELMQGERRSEVREMLAGVRHVVVDEFQDLSGARGLMVCTLLELLSPPGKKGAGFTVLGDEAQAIYGFSARNGNGCEGISTAEMIARIRREYQMELVVSELQTNHRSTPTLATLARNLRTILVGKKSGDKKLDAMRKVMECVPILEGEVDLNTFGNIPVDSVAILTRTNGEAIRIYQQLLGKGAAPPDLTVVMGAGSQARSIPAWVGAILGRFPGATVTRTQFGKIYRFLFGNSTQKETAFLDVPDEDNAWKHLAMATGTDAAATSFEMRVLRERLEWRDFLPDDVAVQPGSIHIMTIHQSKGMEFDAVSLLEADGDTREADDPAEEASVIFVGMTRAGKLLQRIARDSLLPPLMPHRFADNSRTRWERWWNGWMNLETGLPGDVAPASFIDTRIHGSEEVVSKLQDRLAKEARLLHGRKVVLCKRPLPDSEHFVYGIHLQNDDDSVGNLLGTTAPQLTTDIVSRVWGLGYGLPARIYNLRVTDVVTMSLRGDDVTGLANPWAKSGIWLGANIYGTGDFRTYKRGR